MLGTERLASKDVTATIAVKDLEKAKEFYERTLGLTPLDSEESEALTYRSGHTTVLVYRSQYAGTNRATAATWNVGHDVENVVDSLRKNGVRFEHYDLPGMTLEGDVHKAEHMKAAWFKDPDGNILGLVGD